VTRSRGFLFVDSDVAGFKSDKQAEAVAPGRLRCWLLRLAEHFQLVGDRGAITAAA